MEAWHPHVNKNWNKKKSKNISKDVKVTFKTVMAGPISATENKPSKSSLKKMVSSVLPHDVAIKFRRNTPFSRSRWAQFRSISYWKKYIYDSTLSMQFNLT